jgi:uncharacterized Zn-binding protein involved in type VI secretion
MSIIGWIRQGDMAACKAIVAEGCQENISYGRAMAYQGAKMACGRRCVIAGGYEHSVLQNGKNKVLHGMLTTGLCPLISTLNGIHGLQITGAQDPPGPMPDPPPAHLQRPVEQVELHELQTRRVYADGSPIANVPYTATFSDGSTRSGTTDADGFVNESGVPNGAVTLAYGLDPNPPKANIQMNVDDDFQTFFSL